MDAKKRKSIAPSPDRFPNGSIDPTLSAFKEDFEKASQSRVTPWEDLQDARIFITGGTGFFGSWLLRILQWANESKNLNLQVDVLSRNPNAFLEKRPEFKGLPFLNLIPGDVRDFEFPGKVYSHVIHAATEASSRLNHENPLLMIDTIAEGTRRVLEFTRHCGATRFLFTSSGAVYGKQPSDLAHCPENYLGGPNPMSTGSAYAEGKRFAEQLCASYHHQFQIDTVVARCFAFAGPYLPWDIHFAIGNFIRDSMNEGIIRINGDGTPYRSYLYGADLAYWLLTLLTQGRGGEAYNVGSETQVSIKEIAERVAETVSGMLNRNLEVRIARVADLSKKAERYVPLTEKARAEFGLKENFEIREAIARSVNWYRHLAL